MLIHRAKAAGFTMIEMIVTLSIFSLLVALTVPTMRTWVASTKIRAVADALQNGVRMAQTESLRRSRQVVFALTNSQNPQVGFTAAANGTAWAVQTVPALIGEIPEVLQTGVLTSAGSNVAIAGQAEICFNSVGRLVPNAATGVPGGICSAPVVGVNNAPTFAYDITLLGGTPLRVQVGLGGQLHLCDPSKALTSTNPYGC